MEYDVFISHAYEDKEEFVRDLANALDEIGLSVWYDEFTLSVGDSLVNSINKGLKQSSFGIVVLSPSFFQKPWPKRELSVLINRENTGEKIILPIWHKISEKDVFEFFPIIADKYAVNSSEGMSSVIHKILKVIRPDLLAMRHYAKGLWFEQEKMPSEAIREYIKVLKIDSNHHDALSRIIILTKLEMKLDVELGTIARIADRGFGFIRRDSSYKDLFFHSKSLKNACIKDIRQGDRVVFLVNNEAEITKLVAIQVLII